MGPVADLVLKGGKIWCGAGLPVAEALAAWQGKVLAVGSDAEIAPLPLPGAATFVLGRPPGGPARDFRPRHVAGVAAGERSQSSH